MKKLTVKVNDQYDILIEKGLLSEAGKLISDVLKCKKIALISDSNVFPIYGGLIKASLIKQGYEVFEFIFKAGEIGRAHV